MRVAVIGGGLFGTIAATDLARAGAQVDLFEGRGDILEGASGRCQARLHRGYHYPRSDATAAAARDAAQEFAARFPTAIRTDAAHHYVIAEDSKVSAEQYLAFCDRLGLPYQIVDHPMVHGAQVTVRVPESFIDVDVLRRLLRADLARAGVDMRLDAYVRPGQLDHDLIVQATYGEAWPRPLQYEVCEVALVEVGRYEGQSFVVLDGDHVSLDPYHGVHMLYDVKHSVRWAGEGDAAVPPHLQELADRSGILRSSPSNVNAMLETAGQHLRALDPLGRGVVIYHGSMFSVRAVLPDVDATDERPTLVERDGNVVRILSGKMCTAVAAARKVTEMAALEAVPA